MLRRERVCPHCRTVLTLVALVGVGAGALGCSSIASDSDEGTGGSGAGGGSGTAASGSSKSAKSTTASTTSGWSATSSYGTPASSGGGWTCDDLELCEGDGFDPFSGCLPCAGFDDSHPASDSGACAAEFDVCFGVSMATCDGALEPQCCAYLDCEAACDVDLDGIIDPGIELDCFCTNDGEGTCSPMQLAGTCLGDFPDGRLSALGWEQCAVENVCANTCGS